MLKNHSLQECTHLRSRDAQTCEGREMQAYGGGWCRSRPGSERGEDRDGWERATPRRQSAVEDEWEATPARGGEGLYRGGSSKRPGTGASTWDYLASPAPSPVRAGSAGGALLGLLLSRAGYSCIKIAAPALNEICLGAG